ncbi:hypothetical protein Cs7R123_41070 [Catellatospora sp. TT07R-123]|uniref:hypothetical protein n=1 Tax=Catellatospora sp. TT07R-123 TaxID=2733863 RepID=UPI001B17FD44|nr:hypothetical protein [Catellatospora sp. TT07R-123]GHJ46765.1 hypothetical protein Cs7R123_41070 [Catellatospora sp. TT07R-123]
MARTVPRLGRLTRATLVACGTALLLVVSGTAAAQARTGLNATTEVFIQDTSSDTGAEPSTVSPYWTSPAIKVCPWTATTPPVECSASQDQLVIGNSYHVWVTLSNSGTADAVGTLELRRTKPGGATNWNTDWATIGVKTEVTVPAGGVTRVFVQFDNVPGPGHFCLAALWDSDGDELKAFPADQDKVVTNDNNVAQRNVNSIALKKSQQESRSYSIGNNTGVTTHTNLVLSALGTPFQLSGGQIVVDLGPVLFQRWQQAGSWSSGVQPIGGTRLQLVSSTAKIEELTLNPAERVTVSLLFTAGSSMPVGGVYGLSVDQGKPSPITCNPGPTSCPPPPNRTPVGGVRYAITVTA